MGVGYAGPRAQQIPMLEWFVHSLSAGGAAGIAAIATVSAACIALLGVFLSAIISLLISGRNLFVNTVTIERSKWIEKLRQNIASCSGLLRTLSYKVTAGNLTAVEREEFMQKINRLISLIRLQLNPFGEIDQTILSLLESMPALAEQQNGAPLRTADDRLIKHSQWLLKAEWEKVKYEPRWWLFRWYGRAKARCHLARYTRFRDGDGGRPRPNDGEGERAPQGDTPMGCFGRLWDWLKQFGRWLKAIDGVILAFATVMLVWLAAWQWDALEKADQTNRAINRAFVKGKELQISQDMPLYWNFIVVIENTGSTQAKNLEAFVDKSFTPDEVNMPPPPGRKTPLFAPRDPEDAYQEKHNAFPPFTRIPLGAKAVTVVQRYGIPAQVIATMATKRSDGYISGVLWYDDVFLRSERHKSKFCFVVQPVKKGDAPSTVNYGLCQYWNCTDDECDKLKKTTMRKLPNWLGKQEAQHRSRNELAVS